MIVHCDKGGLKLEKVIAENCKEEIMNKLDFDGWVKAGQVQGRGWEARLQMKGGKRTQVPSCESIQ